MNKIILIIVSILFLSGCQTTSLEVNKKEELVLKNSITEVKLSNKVTQTDSLSYKNVSIKQYILKDEYGRILFYEDVETDLNFEFKYSDLNTLLLIFGDISKYEIVYRSNNLVFVQLLLRDDTRLNVMFEASSTQLISYVYGFSNYEFIKLAKKIKADSKGEVNRLRYQSQTITDSQMPLTKWNERMVYFAPLITHIRGMGRS